MKHTACCEQEPNWLRNDLGVSLELSPSPFNRNIAVAIAADSFGQNDENTRPNFNANGSWSSGTSGAAVSGLVDESVTTTKTQSTSDIVPSPTITTKTASTTDGDVTTTSKKRRLTRARRSQVSLETLADIRRTRRAKANDRERRRMQSVNSALDRLRRHLPIDLLHSAHADDSKLTKIETLRYAHNYIWALSETLAVLDGAGGGGGGCGQQWSDRRGSNPDRRDFYERQEMHPPSTDDPFWEADDLAARVTSRTDHLFADGRNPMVALLGATMATTRLPGSGGRGPLCSTSTTCSGSTDDDVVYADRRQQNTFNVFWNDADTFCSPRSSTTMNDDDEIASTDDFASGSCRPVMSSSSSSMFLQEASRRSATHWQDLLLCHAARRYVDDAAYDVICPNGVASQNGVHRQMASSFESMTLPCSALSSERRDVGPSLYNNDCWNAFVDRQLVLPSSNWRRNHTGETSPPDVDNDESCTYYDVERINTRLFTFN